MCCYVRGTRGCGTHRVVGLEDLVEEGHLLAADRLDHQTLVVGCQKLGSTPARTVDRVRWLGD